MKKINIYSTHFFGMFLIAASLLGVVTMEAVTGVFSEECEIPIMQFEDVFVSCVYKRMVDATMRMWGYVRLLNSSIITDDEVSLVCDALVGRLALVDKQADALLHECHKGMLLLADDVLYLIDVLQCIDREYYTIVCRRGKQVHVNMDPLYAMREKFLQLVAI